jgi:hypothetical protein
MLADCELLLSKLSLPWLPLVLWLFLFFWWLLLLLLVPGTAWPSLVTFDHSASGLNWISSRSLVVLLARMSTKRESMMSCSNGTYWSHTGQFQVGFFSFIIK